VGVDVDVGAWVDDGEGLGPGGGVLAVGVGPGEVVLVVGVGVGDVPLVVGVGVGPPDVVNAPSAPYDVPDPFVATSR